MFKTKRKRAVVLALIAFFCVGATTYVAVDWKRFGGGFLAFLHGKGEAVVATTGTPSGPGGSHAGTGDSPTSQADAPQRVAIASTRKHSSGAPHGAGGGKSDEDLFRYGDPAAGGGIPPGSFIVAQNENSGNRGESPAPAPGPAIPAVTTPVPGPGGEAGGGAGGASGTPGGSNPGGGDASLPITNSPSPAPTPPVAPIPPIAPPPPVVPTPSAPSVSPTPSPPAPAPGPIQSGSTDPGDAVPPSLPSTPSAVPEASNLAMMTLGALFLAVAASRRRKNA